MRKRLIATKNMSYATRALRAGDEFNASPSDARILIALGRASEVPAALAKVTEQGFKVPPPPIVHASTTQSAGDDHTDDTDDADDNPLKALRAEYQEVVGKRAFPGWDETELRRRMAEHKDAAGS